MHAGYEVVTARIGRRGPLIGRGARFYLVAGLIVAGGERMEAVLESYVERIGWAVVGLAVAVGLFVWLAG